MDDGHSDVRKRISQSAGWDRDKAPFHTPPRGEGGQRACHGEGQMSTARYVWDPGSVHEGKEEQ